MRGAGETVHRVGNPLGHPVPDRGAEKNEQHRRRSHPAIELVDLLLDLLAPVRQRHRDDPVAAAGAHGRRREAIRVVADLLVAHERRGAVDQDALVDIARRARREQQ